MDQLIFQTEPVFSFLQEMGVPLVYAADMQAIGLERNGKLIGGVIYTGYSSHNIFMHVAGTNGVHWVTKTYLKAAFAYPFKQLNCKRVSGWVDASNQKARRFDEHLGFKKEAVLEGAAMDGGDVIIYRMWKDECRFI